MNADNWTQCPRCVQAHINDVEKNEREVEKLYGVVNAAKYAELQSALADLKAKKIPDMLREDWEIGISGNKFSIDYYARCAICGFEYGHVFEQDLEILGEQN